MIKYLVLFLKGIAMGAANIIPGVSGGTIAFITGIYQRLLNAISSVNLEAAKILCKSVQTLRNERFLRKGCVFVKMGRSVRYLKSDLYDYLQSHRIVPEG